MIARFDQMYIASDVDFDGDEPDHVPVAVFCDICGKRISPMTDTISVSSAIQAAALHQAAEHP